MKLKSIDYALYRDGTKMASEVTLMNSVALATVELEIPENILCEIERLANIALSKSLIRPVSTNPATYEAMGEAL